MKTRMSVIQTPCAPILKDHIYVAVEGVTLVMVKTVQVQ